MKPQDHTRYHEAARHGTGESRRDGVGPQGAALILELQRLRQAFDSEDAKGAQSSQAPRPAREGFRPAGRQPTRQPKRRRKGKVGWAIDVCLDQLGFHAAAPAARRDEKARVAVENPASRRRGIVTPVGPISMDAVRLGLEIAGLDNKNPPRSAHRPRLVDSDTAGNVAPERSVGQVIDRCRLALIRGRGLPRRQERPRRQ